MYQNQDLITIGTKIREERKAQNLSQEALAEDAGVTQNNISRTELGTSMIRLDNFISICEALSVSPNQLLPDRLSENDHVSGDAFRISHRLNRLSGQKRKEAQAAIDMILLLAGA